MLNWIGPGRKTGVQTSMSVRVAGFYQAGIVRHGLGLRREPGVIDGALARPAFTHQPHSGHSTSLDNGHLCVQDRKFMKRTSKTPVQVMDHPHNTWCFVFVLRRNPHLAALLPQEARLISAKEGQAGSNKLYYIDYAVRRPEDTEERIFVSAVSLGFNGRQVSSFAMFHQLLEPALYPEWR